MRLLHAIHDFLPRHRAGSEIYALELCRELGRRHDVTVVCADFDPMRRHGEVAWRVHDGVPVVEIVNNQVCESFEDTYRSPLVGDRLGHVLDVLQPDVVHAHSLFNLSFDLPAMARARRIPVVATLHDYTLVCPSGGQRLHRAAEHLCREIDPSRCARCFRESVFYTHISFGRLTAIARRPGPLQRAALRLSRRYPSLVAAFARAARRTAVLPVSPSDIERRLAAARRVFDDVDLFVAPSRSMADEYERLGIERSRIRVSDYGFAPLKPAVDPGGKDEPLRIGYVGTLVWHKGVHVLVDAVRRLPASSYEVKIFGSPDASPEYAADLRARAAGLPVRFMGAFDRDRAADAYAAIDVLVVPSLWLENSPLVIHEAFMAGVPVVAARVGGIADLIEDGRSGLLYDGSAEGLHAALRRLMDMPERGRELARAAPPVMTIADDARGWEETYAGVVRRAAEGLLTA